MEKFITKKLEKFVSIAQNHIFASRFLEKARAFNGLVYRGTDTFIKGIVGTYRKTYKYAYGKQRIKGFLINNIDSFEREHVAIVSMIEDQNVKENWERYLQCKSRISAILRANRRMTSLKATDKNDVQSYINEYITHRRFAPKYELT